jgi:alkylhydroperoxidase family enzyme
VDDELFARLRAVYDDDTIVELTMTIAWENASSKDSVPAALEAGLTIFSASGASR